MPPDEASKIEDIAWEQDWIHMSRHFRVASPKKITVWREAENCNYLRNAMWCGGERGNFIEATKRKRKTKSPNWGKVNKSSNKFACDTFMDHVPGYFGSQWLPISYSWWGLPSTLRELRGVPEVACCQFIFLRIEMKFRYMRHNYERQVRKLQARLLDCDIPDTWSCTSLIIY